MTSSTVTPTSTKSRKIERPLGAAVFMAALLALMWALEVADYATDHSLDNLGIHARDPIGLAQIFSAPFLHYGWGHLAGNSIPFFVLGWLVMLGGLTRWLLATALVVVVSGLAAWGLSVDNSVTLGASGVIFGWLTYLLARGIFARNVGQILISVVVLFVYGGMIWGIFPGNNGVSWQGHLGGAIGGVAAAWLLHRRDRAPSKTSPSPAPTL